MLRDVETLIRPRRIAVVGASSRNQSQGNIVIDNLTARGYAGKILPVHPTAGAIDGLLAISSIADLPPGVDLAIASVPAGAAADTAAALDAAGVASAIFFAAGFTAEETDAFRKL